jgi:hypothetical protein
MNKIGSNKNKGDWYTAKSIFLPEGFVYKKNVNIFVMATAETVF